ncbi:MAG TPA: hypothetical protein VK002_10425 [Rubricoccaceae bacterium]|nr:hypothetical protein [Rubricoccaceae bacterium]
MLPYVTIARANTPDLDPGDAVRFRAGQTFEGNLVLTGAAR